MLIKSQTNTVHYVGKLKHTLSLLSTIIVGLLMSTPKILVTLDLGQ